MKDIRILKFLEDPATKRAFSCNVPVFTRVDLGRVLFMDEILQQKIAERIDYAVVYADIDVLPIPLQAEIDTRREILEEFGIVMAEGTHRHARTNFLPYYENGFQILYTNPTFLKALKTVMIDLGVKEADMFSRGKGIISKEDLEEYVYNLYEHVFSYHYALRGWMKIYYVFAGISNNKPEGVLIGGEVDLGEVERKTLPVVFAEMSRRYNTPNQCLMSNFMAAPEPATQNLMFMRSSKDTGTQAMGTILYQE